MYLHAISRILTALYFSCLLVFSHKNFGLRREPLMLLNYDKKIIQLPVYIKVSKGNKAGTTPQRIRQPDVTRQMQHIVGFSAFR